MREKVWLRTLGLYILMLLMAKIFLYDVWYGIDDAIVRVIAFIVVGVLCIVLSTMYTKKIGNTLKGELSWKNFW